ncbi:MAG: hypothetical protein NTZ26_14965 [Candidatus Aminicenantes bacterium]|nr:hypothetical protein [Candidatus Aminicenantes bacterium]
MKINSSKAAIYLLPLLMMSCSDRSAQLTLHGSKINLKVGVVMKSGDVKNVARQDFVVSKIDILTILPKTEASGNASYNFLQHQDIENNVKNQIDYDNKNRTLQSQIISLNNQINSLNERLSVLQNEKQAEIETLLPALKQNMKLACDLSLQYGGGFTRFDEGNRSYAEIRSAIIEQEALYKKITSQDWQPGLKKEWAGLHTGFLGVLDSFRRIDAPLNSLRVEIEKKRASINSIKSEIEALKSDLAKRVSEISDKDKKQSAQEAASLEEKRIANLENSFTEFQKKFSESIITTFKTNLNGDAEIILPKGKYFVVGIAQIGLNEIFWNYSILIDKGPQKFELSNDNSTDISGDTQSILRRAIYRLPVSK